MKFVDEYKNAEIAGNILKKIEQTIQEIGHPVFLMEVCGTHTMAIFRHGIKNILPSPLKLLSGPGCPVCVTPPDYIDYAIALSQQDDVIVCSFGDMLHVPGTESSLAKQRAMGRDIRAVYSPLDALNIAVKNPDKKICFLAVGFETTSPTIAGTIMEACERGITNFFISSAHKLIPPAMKLLVEDSDIKIDGFICPAHVSAIIGSSAYQFLAKDYKIPCAVIGFEPLDILQGILMLLHQIFKGEPKVQIQYSRIVKKNGNSAALKLLREVFIRKDSTWRGLGIVSESGLALSEPYQHFDIHSIFQFNCPEAKDPPGCLCAEVLKGTKEPDACSLFKNVCTPENPVGPCMVSQEGTCAAYYKYGGNS